MSLEFIPLTIDLRKQYEEVFQKTPIKLADYTFTNLWGWSDFYGLSIAFLGEIAIIRQEKPCFSYWSIIGDWTQFDFNILKTLPKASSKYINLANNINYPSVACPVLSDTRFAMQRVPIEFAEFAQEKLGQDQIEILEARGQWEYIYSKEELTKLSGNRFHKKKNHVNGFYKAYGNNFYPLQLNSHKKGSIEEVLSLQEEWCKCHDCEASVSLLAENDVIFRVVGNWEKLGNLIGGSLYVEDKMVAFTIAEELTEDTLVIHFEKAKIDYRGAYQAINHAFLNHVQENSKGIAYTHINREQDAGEEGLRKAKLSYLPTHYLKKCTLVFHD